MCLCERVFPWRHVGSHAHSPAQANTDFIYFLLDVFLKVNAMLSVIFHFFLLVIITLFFPSNFRVLAFIFSHFSLVTELCIKFEPGVLYFKNVI